MTSKIGPFSERNVHEGNVHAAFWKVVEALKEGKEYKGDVSLFPHIGAKYVRGESVPLLDLSPMQLAALLLKLFWGKPELRLFIREAFSPPLLFALVKELEERKGWDLLKEMLNDERDRDIALEVVAHLHKEEKEPFVEQLMKIAQREVGAVQHKALEALADFVDKEEVKELFLSFLDDWDKEVRKISATALAKAVDGKVKERAKEALELEQDPYIAFLMRRLIEEKDAQGNGEDTP